jgi:hypothetical protein
LPYLLTLAGHGFYWLRIPRIPHPDSEPAAATRHELPHEEHATEQPVDVLIPEDGT